MENEDKNHQCFRCGKFDRYYTKGVKQFHQTKLGWCCKKACDVKATDSCEHFSPKKYCRRQDRLIKYYLSDILTEISELRKVVEENEREKL